MQLDESLHYNTVLDFNHTKIHCLKSEVFYVNNNFNPKYVANIFPELQFLKIGN